VSARRDVLVVPVRGTYGLAAMSPNTRTAALAGGIAVGVLVAGGIGFALGRSTREGAARVAAESATPGGATPAAPSIPSPTNAAVAIDASGAVLRPPREGDVTIAAPDVPCESLVTPGLSGECGDVDVAGERIVWIVERGAAADGVSGFAVRVLSHSPTGGGWVDRLAAEDLAARRWADVGILPADLSHDGAPELLVGYRGLGDRQPLDLDVVGYSQDGLPEVVAHPDPADRGAVVVNAAGQLLEYAARYEATDAACCPATYELRTITYEGGLLRQVATETVPPGSVPPSQL